ncbi:hypothetical protein BDF14DRAFT_1882061 [Spinellus fusiger]|nr:hypothetical protein BDF14DRAFT_1882061 [Spinellus fusiger]
MLFNIFRAKTSTPKPSLDYLSGPPPDKLVQSFLIALPVIEKALTTNVSSDVASTCINHLTSLHPLLQLASNPEQTSQKHHSNANALIRFLHWARSTNEKDNDKSDSVTQKELSEYYIKLQAIEAIIDRIISDYSLDTPDSFQDTTLLPDYSYKHINPVALISNPWGDLDTTKLAILIRVTVGLIII